MYLEGYFSLLHCDRKSWRQHLWKTYYKVELRDARDPEANKALLGDEREKESQLLY